MTLDFLHFARPDADLALLILESDIVIVDIIRNSGTLILIRSFKVNLPIVLFLGINNSLWINQAQNNLDKHPQILDVYHLGLLATENLPEIVQDLPLLALGVCIWHVGQESELDQHVFEAKIV